MKRLFSSCSLRTKIGLALIFSAFLVLSISILSVYRYTLNLQLSQLRQRLIGIAQTAALMIDGDLLLQVPLNKEGSDTSAFKVIADKLNEIRRANPCILHIYTLAKTEEPSTLQFIVDPDLYDSEEIKKGVASYPGDKYDASQNPEMLRGLSEPSADKKLIKNPWGMTISGYAPIRDRTGQVVAILGVDFMSDHVHQIQQTLIGKLMLALFLGILSSCVLSIFISRGITRAIKELVEGTHLISQGDLKHRIKIEGGDEVAKLAESFNIMAANLERSRRELHSYFYRTARSLILTLEAKDSYTRGHSERVAEHSRKIALALGFSQEEADLLKEVAILHDIGKIGVPEEILNKKERLTEAEWEIIRQHPSLGEGILKPVFEGEEMLSIVRHHHERVDGKGYPDRIPVDKINLSTQIVSAADTYDAMISNRPYRPALSKESAIAELLKSQGTQLSPKVVKVFVEILQREKDLEIGCESEKEG
ncbi:TPA: hypothetical protein DCX15_01170 [bacterium]|nr:hypothetical protein [bacterium]